MHHIYSMVDYYYAGGKDKESDDKHIFIWIYYFTDLIHSFIYTYNLPVLWTHKYIIYNTIIYVQYKLQTLQMIGGAFIWQHVCAPP